ncbi:flavin reductase family protein [Nonomuraea harbinensis]|uniref:Flavin reductase family protein n=1 Tax=Nonomuraea harbinensis TaxID=1286938 RepID=A0ABW1C8Y1_9ACTN|nr:flavin reductase family protein [Nonomuraea harbinensis]
MDAQPVPSEQTVHPDQFRHVIGHFPTGVAVLTTVVEGEGHGATVSALTSLSMEPPMLLVCLKHTSRTLSAIKRRGSFLVNLLAEDQAHVAAHFATREGAKIAPPDPEGEGLPVVPGALGAIECEVESMVRGGSHLVITATVRRAEVFGGRPLTYYRGRFGGFVPALTLVKPSD